MVKRGPRPLKVITCTICGQDYKGKHEFKNQDNFCPKCTSDKVYQQHVTWMNKQPKERRDFYKRNSDYYNDQHHSAGAKKIKKQ